MATCQDARPIALVVEDEAITRHAAVEMFVAAGFATVAATNGTQAMRLLETTSGIRLVFTDIDMPQGIDGIRLAACVRQRWPEIGIVLTSGKRAPVPGDVPTGSAFVPKPYDDDAVLAAVARLLPTSP